MYPGATHTRFSHSLGVYHLMKIVIERLGDYIERDKIPVLQTAALLHDIGHLPYSHALETFYMNISAGSGERLDHEHLTTTVIREDPELRDLLKSEGIDPEEVCKIVSGRHEDPLFNMLLSSDLDIDRLDYLVRDSLHTGVIYGSIDLRRILSTLEVDRSRRLAISEKGLIAAENFYIARVHMYRTVYYHKTVHGYELMLVRLWDRVTRERPDLYVLRDIGSVREMVSKGLYKYFDDSQIVSTIVSVARDPQTSREARELAEMFLFRRGYKAVYDKVILSDEPLENSEGGADEISRVKEASYALSRAGIDDLYYLPVVENIAVYREDEAVSVVSKSGAEKRIYEHEGSVIRYLPRYLNIVRFYVHPLALKIRQVSDTIEKFFGKTST